MSHGDRPSFIRFGLASCDPWRPRRRRVRLSSAWFFTGTNIQAGGAGQFGFGDNVTSLGQSWTEPGQQQMYHLDLLTRLRWLIAQGSRYELDQDLSHWHLTGYLPWPGSHGTHAERCNLEWVFTHYQLICVVPYVEHGSLKAGSSIVHRWRRVAELPAAPQCISTGSIGYMSSHSGTFVTISCAASPIAVGSV